MTCKAPLPLEECDRTEQVDSFSSVSNLRMLKPHLVESEDFASEELDEEAVRFVLLRGKTMNFGVHKDQPGFYSVVEDTPDHGFRDGSLIRMVATLLGEDALTLRADSSNTPESLYNQVENLRKNLGNPEIQSRIRSLFKEREELKRLLGVR